MADKNRDSRGRFVRGGQLDQYPQWLQLPNVIETAAGTFTQSVATQSPVIPASNVVMEILAVEWNLDHSGVQALSADQQANLEAQITSSSQIGMITFNDPALIDRAKDELAVIRNDATGVSVSVMDAIKLHDFGSSGHGFLTAARQFFIANLSSTNLSPLQASARILYRLVKVTEAELLGLIQEQLGV